MPALPPPGHDDKVPGIVWLVCLLVLIGYALASTLVPLS